MDWDAVGGNRGTKKRGGVYPILTNKLNQTIPLVLLLYLALATRMAVLLVFLSSLVQISDEYWITI